RFSATSRVYRYFLFEEYFIPANYTRYVWHVKRKLDLQKLNALASCLQGELDCASFCASGDKSLSTNRYIEKAHFFESGENVFGKTVVFEIEANAFLYKMVRSITGTLLHLEKNGTPDAAFQKILHAKNRMEAGPTAPSNGLFLWQIKFDGVRRHV
ncbi:MAG: tRNA pseudouridine(38-40) synthase TruA, partial [Treponema sp.]|nr:tRNA pseudouridine(38-40) synthase TruA [Treponema sp.]